MSSCGACQGRMEPHRRAGMWAKRVTWYCSTGSRYQVFLLPPCLFACSQPTRKYSYWYSATTPAVSSTGDGNVKYRVCSLFTPNGDYISVHAIRHARGYLTPGVGFPALLKKRLPSTRYQVYDTAVLVQLIHIALGFSVTIPESSYFPVEISA